MMRFLDFPRELRDMIYKEILMPTERRASPQDTQSASNWYLISQPHQTIAGSPIFISSRGIPSTCASMLASNRQINEEMMQIVERARQRGQLATRMDCLVVRDKYYFTWLALPYVKPAKRGVLDQQEKSKRGWMGMVMDSWSWIASVFNTTVDNAKGKPGSQPFSTGLDPSYATIERLWMDIRPFEIHTQIPDSSETSWAICAALKHLFDNGPDMMRRNRRIDCVDEVVLNIMFRGDKAPSNFSDAEREENSLYYPLLLMRIELVDVWDKIWSATEANRNDIQAMRYRTLLERIKRVRICIDGKTFATRGLAVELERGRAEMRKLQMR